MPLINQILGKYKLQIIGFLQTLLMQMTHITLNYVNSLPTEISSDILRIGPQQIQNLNITLPSNVSLTSKPAGTVNKSNSTTTTNNNVLNFSVACRGGQANQMNGSALSADQMDEAVGEVISPDTQYVLDIQTLYKSYFLFLLNLVNNDLMDAFLDNTPNDVYKVYCALLQGVQIGPPDVSKACLQVIKKLISFFGK